MILLHFLSHPPPANNHCNWGFSTYGAARFARYDAPKHSRLPQRRWASSLPVRLNAGPCARHFFWMLLALPQPSCGTALLMLQKLLGFQRGHAAGASGGNGLTKNFILHITGGEHTGHAGFGTSRRGDKVFIIIHR